MLNMELPPNLGIPFLYIYSTEMKICLYKNLHTNIHSSIHSSQKRDTTQLSIN